MYVRVSLRSRDTSVFHWDFEEPTNDHQQAIRNAIRTFWSGLTPEEKRDARSSLDVVAHLIPPAFITRP
jgi:hypothetical protein